MRDTPLPGQGVVWSCTVQRFPPKSPPFAGTFEAYAVGYVDLGEVLVESRLIGPADGFRIGMAVRLVLEPFARLDGSVVATFGFAPDEASA
jgi:uncharacterized OB-fold protein